MDKINIVIIGRRNAGKSSLTNSLLGQEKAIVSDIAGTTTDPVKKSYEIPGFASVIFTDTAGIDDEGALGQQRIEKSLQAIRLSDAAILTFTGNDFGTEEEKLTEELKQYEIPFLIVHNKSDLSPLASGLRQELEHRYKMQVIDFSAHHSDPQILIDALKTIVRPPEHRSLIGPLVRRGDIVMLVTPIDSEAPAGRIILPQVQMIRDVLDNQCISIVLQPEEITDFLERTQITPSLVITDSQVFGKVAQLIPCSIPLTSFSIVLAHHKGNFGHYLSGTAQIDRLRDGDRILMLESCSHHVSCEDIGRVKIPTLLRKHTGKQLEFDFIAGLDQIKRPVTDYALVIQCGGCMITARQLRNRLLPVINAGIPVSNYGMTIAWIQGIFQRTTSPFRK